LVDEGTALHDAIRLDEARQCYEEAVGLAEGTVLGAAWLNLGVLLHEEGELARAGGALERAVALVRSDGRLSGIALSSLGAVRHEAGRPEEAKQLHADARVLLRAAGDERSEGLCLLREALAWAATGSEQRARERIVECEPALLRTGEAPLRAAFDLGRSLADSLLAVPGAARQLERAVLRCHQGTPTPASRSDDVRYLLRLAEGRAHASGLTVSSDGKRLVLPSGALVSLERHPTTRRLLLALVSAHRKQALSIDDLWSAGWPDQPRAVEGAWQNRVYVALSHLRTIGLRMFLRRDERGYSLAPELAVTRSGKPLEVG
jgi:tetratricopeptide (TPR) repeat protein